MKKFRKSFRKQKVYAFIDSQNLNLGTQRMGWKMDWKKFRKFLSDKYGVEKAIMFIGYMPENESLYEFMHSLGFLVYLKPTIETISAPKNDDESKNDSTSKTVVKGNVDTDIVLTVMKEIPNYSKAILVSGDGDFLSLIEHLKEKNKLLHVITPNWKYSTLLKPYEKYIVNLDNYKHELRYRSNHNNKH